METLLNSGFRSDLGSDMNVIDQSFAALMSLTMCAQDKDLDRYIRIFIERFDQALKLNGERKRAVSTGLLSCIQVFSLTI